MAPVAINMNGNAFLPDVPSKQVPLKTQSDNTYDNTETSDTDLVISRLSQYKNPSLFVTPEHTLELRDTPIPTPTSTQVLVHVRATGICGSDLHLWHRGAIGPLVVDHPSILGHEASGVVLVVGSAVTSLKPGDRVAIEPGVPCGTCFLCMAGKYNLCESVAFAGVCPHAGTIRRFMTHEARYCHKMPHGMTFAQGALLEPLSVVLHALSQCTGSIKLGRPALICGAGPIGLIALAAARASGAWPLVVTDVDESRLQFAQHFVPGVQTYHVDVSKSPLDSAEEIRQLFGCGTRDVHQGIPAQNEYNAPSTVLECTGIESSIITASYSCRRAGLVMVVGVGRSVINNLPFMHLSLAEIDLRFINRYSDTWAAGMNALTDGRVLNLDTLVTHTIPLEQAVDAMELTADRVKRSIKVQVVDDVEIQL
ncbi:hypothetical protein H2198_008030 [Neophaeococcomyces mojaviensis]|uniref:Uncharacterized protein n=1 Tax=Neophaeococcomyces mojaviensis TaxID=3383035 RepID=A0ACC2ZYH9_9EURO|nr:hypothetical protein H2198_008030 [Knufia sp. JES_112]